MELIAELDNVLAERRKLWMEAREFDKAPAMAKINELLDKRLKFMKARDAVMELNA